MNKQLAVMVLIGAMSLTEAIKVDQKQSIPDYWNDDRYHGNKGWDDAENPRYADPDQWVNTTSVLYPGYLVPIQMTNAEVQYRLNVAGKRGTGFTFEGNTYGLGIKQGQLNAMADYVQLSKEDVDTLAADAKDAADEEKLEKKAASLHYGPGKKPYEWYMRGDPAEKVSFVDPVIARQHTTFYAQHGEDPAVFGSDEAPKEMEDEPKKKQLNGYKGNHKLPVEKVSFVDPVVNRGHTSFYAQAEPEKVHVLEPEVYQEVANKNKRTTFYAFAQADGDKAKAEQAAADAKKAGDVKEALEQKADAASKVGEAAEKVSIIEPMAYERRYNYNTPFMRTTFYGQRDAQQHLAQMPEYNQKAGIWMLAQQDGDKAKAEQAEADAKKAGDVKEAIEQKADAASKVGEAAEKVSIIEPMAYENRYNYNTPFMRTTFYGQKEHGDEFLQYNEKDGLWMTHLY